MGRNKGWACLVLFELQQARAQARGSGSTMPHRDHLSRRGGWNFWQRSSRPSGTCRNSVMPSWHINMNNWNLGKPYFKLFKLIQGISFFLQVYWIFIFWYQLLIISWLNFYFHINLIKPGLSLVSVGLKNSQFLSNRTNNWSLFHSHKRCVS